MLKTEMHPSRISYKEVVRDTRGVHAHISQTPRIVSRIIHNTQVDGRTPRRHGGVVVLLSRSSFHGSASRGEMRVSRLWITVVGDWILCRTVTVTGIGPRSQQPRGTASSALTSILRATCPRFPNCKVLVGMAMLRNGHWFHYSNRPPFSTSRADDQTSSFKKNKLRWGIMPRCSMCTTYPSHIRVYVSCHLTHELVLQSLCARPPFALLYLPRCSLTGSTMCSACGDS
ncbi:hypothetical protein F5148DRAFT_630583 [Russula earlei]|uniref:Uncharacterized protein n=1 Tax=Russula earlei TaxID=71964 RepID=A0ACC0UF47_9AGAM|nr:hypothetical protein F5148DRAFT_630583 [Russula earlei]